jgi:hypothetical protein
MIFKIQRGTVEGQTVCGGILSITLPKEHEIGRWYAEVDIPAYNDPISKLCEVTLCCPKIEIRGMVFIEGVWRPQRPNDPVILRLQGTSKPTILFL